MNKENELEIIDWSDLMKYPVHATVSCRCGTYYRSRARIVMEPKPHSVSQLPCPNCGKNNDIGGVSFDPEVFTIS